jgi:hypothetical protein
MKESNDRIATTFITGLSTTIGGAIWRYNIGTALGQDAAREISLALMVAGLVLIVLAIHHWLSAHSGDE